MIINHLEMAKALTQQKVNSDLKVAHDILYTSGTPRLDRQHTSSIDAIDQESKQIHSLEVPAFLLDKEPLLYHYGIVDKIQELVGGTATIFQIIPEGALRISTNVLDLIGKRAVGTYIPKNSPVYQTVMNGETFYGRAYVVNDWYQTAYEPIHDSEGQIIGMLYVGVNDASETILGSLSDIIVGKSGYVWILNLRGEYVLSHKRRQDGENIFDTRDSQGRAFIQEWLQRAPSLKKGETIIDYYPWQNDDEKTPKMKIVAYTYFPDWGWLVGASAYVEDFQETLKTLRSITLLVSTVAILIGSFVAYLLARVIINPLFRSVDFAEAIAAGNLTARIDIRRKNEIGILAHSLQMMQSTIQAVLQEIHGLVQDVQHERLSSRGNAEAFEGGWRDLVEGINTVMKEIEGSVAETRRQQQEAEHQKIELERQNWLKDGESQLSMRLAGELSLQEICRQALNFTARYLNAGKGTVYTYHAEEQLLTLRGSFAFTERDSLSHQYHLGESVIGQVALERSPILLKHLQPEEGVITTGTISEAPLNTYTIPLLYNNNLYGVLELASFEAFDEKRIQFLFEANRVIATAIFSALQKERTQELLRQAEQHVHNTEKA